MQQSPICQWQIALLCLLYLYLYCICVCICMLTNVLSWRSTSSAVVKEKRGAKLFSQGATLDLHQTLFFFHLKFSTLKAE